MSGWIFVLGYLLYCISLSSADGVSTDGLLLFDENINPLHGISAFSLDPTDRDPNLVSNLSVNGDENSDFLANALPNDSDSGSADLLFDDAGADPNSIVDNPTLISDCTSSIVDEGYLRDRKNKKARIRRQTACHNPYSTSGLSLPTLDQANSQHPRRPKTDQEKEAADSLNVFSMQVGVMLKAFRTFLNVCQLNERMVCSSGDRDDQKLEANGETCTLENSAASEYFVSCFPNT